MQTLTLGFVIYIVISIIIYFYASSLSSYMGAPEGSVEYLQMETIGFVLGFISAFMYVVFVVRGKWTYIVLLLAAKVTMLSVGNFILISEHGVMGVAMTNIIVNSILLTVSMLLLRKEGLLQFRTKFDKDTMKDWTHTGIFSGGMIFIDNIVYMLIIVRMVNEVSSVGVYWLANNFIWGWLLIPIVALVEIVKRDYYRGYSRIYNYLAVAGVIMLIWLCSVPLWNVMFTDLIRADDPQSILNILYLAVPFYVAYAFAAVFDGVLISVGKVKYIMGISLIVNIGYYGIVYSMFLLGFFEATIPFIITMFGFGMVVHLVFSVLFYLHSKHRLPIDIQAAIQNG
jgi:Na+-driven multidrug efflux pump